MIRIIRTDSHDDEILAMDAVCFPDPVADTRLVLWPQCECWVALDGDEPVGYAVAYLRDGASYLDRYGVLPEHGGEGIGKRLLRAWLRWSKREGAEFAWTYTYARNGRSGNALISAGLRLWETPVHPGTTTPASERHCHWRVWL